MTYTQIDSNTGEMKIYGHISEWWNSAEDFARVFEEMERKYKNIHIRMHCFGGNVFEGNVIYNIIAKSKSSVTIFVDGIAASMGSIILQAAHKRVIADNAFVMIHRPYSYTQGDSKAHSDAAKLLTDMEKNFKRTYARRSGKPEKDMDQYMDGSDHWLGAEDAKEAGLIDEISEAVVVDLPDNSKPSNSADVKSIYNRYAAKLIEPAAVPPISSKTNNHTMKKVLIARFSLTGVDENTADEAFVAALEKHFNELRQANQNLVAAQVESVIATAEKVKGQPFDAAMRTTLAEIGTKTGVNHLMVALGVNAATTVTAAATATTATAATTIQADSVPRVVNLVSAGSVAEGGANARASWTWDDYQKNDPEALAALEKSDRAAFSALYKSKYGVNPSN